MTNFRQPNIGTPFGCGHWFERGLYLNWLRYRKATGFLRALPGFIIIGSGRGGTTGLYYTLATHPNIMRALLKEPSFFSSRYFNCSFSYKSIFPILFLKKIFNQKGITGEASVDYLYYPHAPKRIAQMIPAVKIIAMLRNPINRAYSHWSLNLRKGDENLSFEDAIEKEEERIAGEMKRMITDERYYSWRFRRYAYKERGKYADQIVAWFETFPKEQILIIKSEDYFNNSSKVLKTILDFLSLSPYEFKGVRKVFPGRYEPMYTNTRKYLIDYFKPHNEKLYKLLGISFDWDR